jgi:Leucine-rich repeat (LRR) protein
MELHSVGKLLASWRNSDLSGLSAVTSIDISHTSAPARFHSSFTALCSLENLRLRNVGLTALPGAENGLESLDTLKLRYCSKLTSIGPISSLTELYIEGCNKLKLLPGLGGMSSLQELEFNECEMVCELPDSISQLTELSRLWRFGLPALKALPEGLCGLKSLWELRVGDCGIVSLPSRMQELTALREVSFDTCDQLTSLPAGLGQVALERLCLVHCYHLESIQGSWKKVSSRWQGPTVAALQGETPQHCTKHMPCCTMSGVQTV